MKKEITYSIRGLILISICFGLACGLVGWSIGNPDRASYKMQIAALQSQISDQPSYGISETFTIPLINPDAWGWEPSNSYSINISPKRPDGFRQVILQSGMESSVGHTGLFFASYEFEVK